MKPVECDFEQDVMAAVFQSRWPDHVDASLRQHAAHCLICSDIVTVAGALDPARAELLASASLPEAGRVWHAAQLRARREAVEAAGRPITAAQVIALGIALCLLGAGLSPTSAWFQTAFARVDWSALLLEHGAFLLGLAVSVFLIPTFVFVALRRD